jgi:hypothetical protein
MICRTNWSPYFRQGARGETDPEGLFGHPRPMPLEEYGHEVHVFTISGSVGGLVPGSPTPLRVTVANPDSQAIRLNSVTATAGSAGSACPASLLTISTFSGTPETIVAARSQALIELTVKLSAQAPNACKKVSFPLTYAGKAEQWH